MRASLTDEVRSDQVARVLDDDRSIGRQRQLSLAYIAEIGYPGHHRASDPNPVVEGGHHPIATKGVILDMMLH